MKLPTPIATAYQMREAREAAKLTQLELADHLAMSRVTVNRLESGQMLIQPHTARLMAFLFAWLAQSPTAAPAKPAHKTLHYKKGSYYNFALTDGTQLKLLSDVDALPPGTRYRVQENLSGFRTCIRGTGSRHDDELVE